MGIEIERKFLLRNESWKKEVTRSTYFKQGYLSSSVNSSVRVRIEGDKANINIKSATLGISRKEYEYEIPVFDAEELLNELCDQPLIEKIRNIVFFGKHEWEIDAFKGDNQGLVVAEVELVAEDEVFDKPDWLGEEVSSEIKYYNTLLVRNPYKNWV